MQSGDMTIPEVMDFLNVSRQTLTRWRQVGRGNKRLRWRWEGQILIRRADLLAFCKVIGRNMGCEPVGIVIEES